MNQNENEIRVQEENLKRTTSCDDNHSEGGKSSKSSFMKKDFSHAYRNRKKQNIEALEAKVLEQQVEIERLRKIIKDSSVKFKFPFPPDEPLCINCAASMTPSKHQETPSLSKTGTKTAAKGRTTNTSKGYKIVEPSGTQASWDSFSGMGLQEKCFIKLQMMDPSLPTCQHSLKLEKISFLALYFQALKFISGSEWYFY